MLFFTTMPLWLSAILLIGLPTAIAMAGPVVIRRFVQLDKLRTNNEVAGFKFATVGVIYAVLLAFTVIVVWEKFSDGQSAVANEAGATAALYRYAQGKEPEAVAMRNALTGYLKAVIEDDWPAMAREAE